MNGPQGWVHDSKVIDVHEVCRKALISELNWV